MLHNQLMNGLNNIGLMDSERYTLNIVSIVADMMNTPKGKTSDTWLDCYHSTMLNVRHDLDTKERHTQAEILFQTLSTIKKEKVR